MRGPRVGAALALCLGVSLTGCTLGWVDAGAPIDPRQVSRLREGQTKPEVLALLGPPDAVFVQDDWSQFAYLYREERQRALELSFFQGSFDYDDEWTRSDRLVIRFDRQGLVEELSIVRLTDRESPDDE